MGVSKHAPRIMLNATLPFASLYKSHTLDNCSKLKSQTTYDTSFLGCVIPFQAVWGIFQHKCTYGMLLDSKC